MATSVFWTPPRFTMSAPLAMVAAPISEPISECEPEIGIPSHVMLATHSAAPSIEASTTVWVTNCGSTRPPPMVLATLVETSAPPKLSAAASSTAVDGLSTRVDTTVAIALAESFQPLV
jgi:hypothetical protein